jgi:hypothetical protein
MPDAGDERRMMQRDDCRLAGLGQRTLEPCESFATQRSSTLPWNHRIECDDAQWKIVDHILNERRCRPQILIIIKHLAHRLPLVVITWHQEQRH